MNLLEYIKERRLIDKLNTRNIHRNYDAIRAIYRKTNIEHSDLTLDSFTHCMKFVDEEISNTNKKLEEIGPRTQFWTKELGGMDPLFLIGPDLKIMEDISKQFNPIYERRLRIYQIEDADFSYLPQKAFSFVFSWYHFEFLPYDIIDRYLAGVFNMLRPGGHAFLSYANCLIEKSAEQFEKHYYCYMTTKLMEGLATKNGFDIVEQEDFQSRMSWVILKKPGRFTKGIKRVPSIGYMRDYRTDKIPEIP